MAWRIKKRLGRFSMVPGLMETMTYDPKLISQVEAWAAYGSDVRRFLNSVNQYRLRRHWRRTHYLWVVEVQPDTGYPHVHVFLPNLKWLAPVDILTSNWSEGRANIKAPQRIMVNCAGYVSKYLRKMEGWDDLPLAFLWSGGCRMYGFSRGFSAKAIDKESDWALWHVVQTENLDQLTKTLEEGGYVIEDKGAGYGG